MASSARFDPVSGSPEGLALPASYSNGQRGTFSAGSLDRSGSFREGSDGRTANTGSTLFRGDVSLYVDMPPMTQCLNLDPISFAEQKLTRLEELKKVLGASSIANEDGAVGAVLHAKPLPQMVLGELKRFRLSIMENSARAKERTKLLNESITKLDKYRHALLSRKRPRNDGLPNERSNSLLPGDRSAQGTSFKMGPQNHQLLGSDLMSPRSDDRTKNIIPNRRIRTSLVEVRAEGRNSSLSRPSGFVEKDRELLRTTNGMSAQAEEKARGLAPGGDGWEKKMKRKRSIGLAVSRPLDGDQDHKRSMQQRLSNENRSRLNDVHGFRSGSANAIVGVNKLDIATQPSGLNVRAIPRTDPDNISADRKDRIIGSDKEKTIVKAISEQNARDGNQLGSPISVAKLKASRAPRTGSGALLNSSTNFPRTGGALEGWEQSPTLNKAQGISTLNNRKRPLSARSSSPVTQWGGQRPQKISRVARRTNLVPPVPNRDEAQLPTDGFPNSDTGARLISVDANGSGHPKRASNISQHFKLKVENIPSPAGFSESEDSGAVDKSKDKARISGEAEDRAVSSIQKATSLALTSKKNKVVTKEELGDGVRRQGRSGRGLASSRNCLPLSREKMDNASNPKHRSTRPVPDKIESKSGRPPTKKFSDRKASARPGNVANISPDFNGKADDDREELIAAATFAQKASYNACSSPFWQQIEPIFAFVTPDAIASLREQRRLAEELENSLCFRTGTDQNGKDQSVLDSFTTFPDIVCEEKQPVQSNEAILNGLGRKVSSIDESQDVDDGTIETNSWFEKIIPLSQRLLAALIVEDDISEANQIEGVDKDNHHYASDFSPCGASDHIHNESRGMDRIKFEIESEGELKNHRYHSHDNFSCDGSAISNGFRSPKTHNLAYKNQEEVVQQDCFTPHSDVGEQHRANGLQPTQTDVSGITLVDCCYQQMSLDDRILLELQSIGLFPETVPGLSQGEDDEITKDLSKLQKDLFHQVKKKKSQLYKLEKAVLRARGLEKRDLERLALNKLVDVAYKKHMACRGGNASHKSGGSKISKQVAVSFVKRTLARCKKYDETGTSCFSEHLFEDGFLAAPACSSDTKCMDSTKDGLTLKPCLESPASQHESKATGVLASSRAISIENCGPHSLNKDLSGASEHAGHSSDQSFGKDEPWPNRGKKRELSLDAVVSNVARGTANLSSSLMGGAKGKRSERDRDHNREGMIRNSVTKTGRPTIGSVRGERKTKTKPRQKTAQLSNAVNGLLCSRPSEVPSPMFNSIKESSEPSVSQSTKVQEVLPNPSVVVAQDPLDPEGAIDLTHLPLPAIEELGVTDDLVDQSQDLGNWLSCPDDVMQDHDNDFEGLEVPMDDLSEVV
ncbi:uncharacterized protein LOC116255106 isoform X1 [Nymphaea colorata]|nr:uncharacterized protein LOC116255106 isoform X1 [Nymphaea colorata]XP_049933705.1 uncharacterized protein LOC116255106 isoform X1 [Nymphaea colorata]